MYLVGFQLGRTKRYVVFVAPSNVNIKAIFRAMTQSSVRLVTDSMPV